MPITIEEIARNSEGGDSSRLSTYRNSFDLGLRQDPNKAAEIRDLSRQTGLPGPVVSDNIEGAKIRKRLQELDLLTIEKRSPATARWFEKPGNTAIAHDDVETLEAIEQNITKRKTEAGYFRNQARGIAETTAKIGTSLTSGATWLAEEATKPFTRANDALIYYLSGGKYYGGAEATLQAAEESVRKRAAAIAQQAEKTYEFDNRADIDKVINDPTPANIGEFIIEAGPNSVPYLIAAGISYPAIVAVIADQVATDRVANDNRTGLPSDADMYTGYATSTVSGAFEKYGADKLLRFGSSKVAPGFLPFAAKEIPKASAIEFGTESVQGGIEAIGGSIGTETGVDPAEVGKQSLAEGLGGLGVGAGVKTVTVYPEYQARVLKAGINAVGERLDSLSEQEWLDRQFYLAQESQLAPRSPEAFEDYIKHIDPDTNILMDAEAAGELDGAPDYIIEQLDGSGADVVIPMTAFLRDFVVGENNRLEEVRPYVKLTETGRTQAQLEAQQASPEVEALIKRAQANEEAMSEADRVYEQVKDQLVATGRQGAATATQSAQLIKSYIVTTHERLKKRGIDTTIEQLFEDIGLTVKGPDYNPNDPQFLTSSEQTEYERAVEKGLPMDEDSRKERAREQGYDPDTVYQVDESGNLSPMTQKQGTGDNSTETDTLEPDGELIDAKTHITSLIDSHEDEYDFFGLRVLNKYDHGKYKAGDVLPPSFVWDDGVISDDLLDGTSAIQIKSSSGEHVELALSDIGAAGKYNRTYSGYSGKQVVLVASDTAEYGNDINEIVMPDAVVLHVYEKESDTIGEGGGLLAVNPDQSQRDTGAGELVYSTNPPNPSKIRSINAAFDPDFKDSPNLLSQQDFGDIELTDTFNDGTNTKQITELAQARWDDAQSRLEMIEQLRKCANG